MRKICADGTGRDAGADRRRASLRKTPRKLLYGGRLLYWKGVHIAVEAMSKLVADMPDAQLTIVGNGPEETRLKSEIAQRNLGANITFVSWMPQEQFLRLYDDP